MKYIKYKHIVRNGRSFKKPEDKLGQSGLQIGGIYCPPGDNPYHIAWASDELDVNSFTEFDMSELTEAEALNELRTYDPDASIDGDGQVLLPNIRTRAL